MAKAYKCDQCGALIERAFTTVKEDKLVGSVMCYVTFRLTMPTEYENGKLVKGGEAEICLSCALERIEVLSSQIIEKAFKLDENGDTVNG